jgi:hypothetical protein
VIGGRAAKSFKIDVGEANWSCSSHNPITLVGRTVKTLKLKGRESGLELSSGDLQSRGSPTELGCVSAQKRLQSYDRTLHDCTQ